MSPTTAHASRTSDAGSSISRVRRARRGYSSVELLSMPTERRRIIESKNVPYAPPLYRIAESPGRFAISSRLTPSARQAQQPQPTFFICHLARVAGSVCRSLAQRDRCQPELFDFAQKRAALCSYPGFSVFHVKAARHSQRALQSHPPLS